MRPVAHHNGQVNGEGAANPSRTRDHLANERTFLAWLRTAANVMVVGLVLAKFGGGTRASSLGAGGILVAVGAAGLVYGTVRYRRVNAELESGWFITGSRGRGPIWASAVLLLAIMASLVLLVSGRT